MDEKGLCERLRACRTVEERREAILEQLRPLLPELNLPTVERWPPTALVYGDADTAVLIGESEAAVEALRARGDVEVQFERVEGGEHVLVGTDDPRAPQ